MNEALEKARIVRQAMKDRGEKVRVLNPIEKYHKKPTLASAVRANCFVCMGGDVDPGGRARVSDCPVSSCYLHAHRPWQKKGPK